MAKNPRPQHILVIRLSALGDVAMLVPVLQVLLNTYPDLKITLLTRGFFAPIFQELPNVEVFPVETKGKHKGVLGLWRLYQELKPKSFTGVADVHNVLRSNMLRLFFKTSRIPFFQIDKGRKEKKALTRENDKIFKPLITTHQRYAEVFEAMGYPLDLEQFSFLNKQTIPNSLLSLSGEKKQNKWVGIAPFAAHTGKMYPLEMMVEVIDTLNSKIDYRILLFGGGVEEIEKLAEIAESRNRVFSVAGGLSFAEELALISNLDIMVAMDSGNAHLAANYGIPVITIWGVTHPYTGFYPFGQPENHALLPDREQFPLLPTSVYGNKVPKGYEKVITTIYPEQIIDKITEVLAKPA
ncbi:MAG: glycosyltransferase family 9 protein [Bacteroidota bacterium]